MILLMTFEAVAIETAKQVPALGLFVFVVWLLLRYLKQRDEVLSEISDRCHENSQLMMDKAVESSDSMMEVVKENSRALGAVHTALNRINGWK